MLTASTILDLADAGANASPVQRALLLVAAAAPALDDVAALPVGRGNAIILEARQAALSEDLASRAACPACDEALEFMLHTSELLAQAQGDAPATIFQVRFDDLVIAARLPTIGDLLAIGLEVDLEAAQRQLLACCVLEAQVHGDPISAIMLPEAAIAALAAEIRARDPLVETTIDMRCPGCEHAWQATLDIPAFVWHEFSAMADRIAGEVDTLARAYGWGEQAILALSARRRRRYLAMIEG